MGQKAHQASVKEMVMARVASSVNARDCGQILAKSASEPPHSKRVPIIRS